MKLNDFKLVENAVKEDSSYFVGDLGKAMLQTANARFNPFSKGNAQLSTKDRMAANVYVKDFIGRASEDLRRGIEGGLIDPNPNAGSAPVNTKPKDEPAKTAPAATTTAAPSPATTPTPSATPTTATTPAVKSPEEIRKEKQKTAAATAQKQMADNPVKPKVTEPVTAPKTPEEIRIEKQAAATANAQDQMAPFSKVSPAPKVWKNNRKPNAPATSSPIQRESIESLLNEAGQYPDTISSYLVKMFKQYNKGLNFTPEIMNKVNELAQQVQLNYGKNGAKDQLNQLANFGYSVNWSSQQGQTPTTEPEKKDSLGQTQPTKTSAVDTTPLSKSGDLLPTSSSLPGAGAVTGASDATTAQPTATTTAPEKSISVYNQAKQLVSKLNKQQKRYVLNALKKELGMPVSTKQAGTDTSSAGANAFGQIASNLASRPTASSTGGTTTGVSGVGSGVVKHTAGKGTKIKQARASKKKQKSTPTPTTKKTTAKKASPFPVAESKTYKVWGVK